MNLSLGEYEALVAKALRGAGYPWGLAEDGAWAARELAAAGPDSPAVLIELLHAIDGRPLGMPDSNWSTDEPALCPICLGTALVDSGVMPSEPFGPMAAPALLTPFLTRLSESRNNQGQYVALDVPRTPESAGERRSRVDVTDEQLVELERFAGRTYAPATEESRAGAGET